VRTRRRPRSPARSRRCRPAASRPSRSSPAHRLGPASFRLAGPSRVRGRKPAESVLGVCGSGTGFVPVPCGCVGRAVTSSHRRAR
jgi:hypothetical protein